jgi:hypothetical protein
VSGGTYEVSQPWSRAIFQHPAGADGIVYRSNHDNGELCVALFDRCRSRLRADPPTDLLSNRVLRRGAQQFPPLPGTLTANRFNSVLTGSFIRPAPPGTPRTVKD